MSEDEYHTRLQELLDKASNLPPEERDRIWPLIEETQTLHGSIIENRRRIEDVLSTWQLELKYFIFALEAAARERAEGAGPPHSQDSIE